MAIETLEGTTGQCRGSPPPKADVQHRNYSSHQILPRESDRPALCLHSCWFLEVLFPHCLDKELIIFHVILISYLQQVFRKSPLFKIGDGIANLVVALKQLVESPRP